MTKIVTRTKNGTALIHSHDSPKISQRAQNGRYINQCLWLHKMNSLWQSSDCNLFQTLSSYYPGNYVFFFQILIIAEVWKLFLFLYTGECRLHIHFHYPFVLCHQECIRLYDYGWLDHCPESKNIHMQISPAVEQLALQDAIPGIQWSVISNSSFILYRSKEIK